jgi:hypothetical protein
MPIIVCSFLRLVLSFYAPTLFGQTLTIEQVMTPTELRATGVVTLTATQKAALNRWLNDYTQLILKVNKGEASTPVARTGEYLFVGSGHWIDSVSSGGRVVTLEDGSLWEINPVDQIDTSLWLPVTDISVIKARFPIGQYMYELINKDDGETALAKYLGKAEADQGSHLVTTH